jgi:hypothetical protein
MGRSPDARPCARPSVRSWRRTRDAIVAHLLRVSDLRQLAVHERFADLPDVARWHRTLTCRRHRRALARGLRHTAAPATVPARADICPVLRDRVEAIRPEMLQIAAAIEHGCDADPASFALIHQLLTDRCSPLYDVQVPPVDLYAAVMRVRAHLVGAVEGEMVAYPRRVIPVTSQVRPRALP